MTLGIGAATEPPRKYRNKPVTVDGIRFASKAEARRYGELLLLQRAKQISQLELQPRFDLSVLTPGGCSRTKIGTYVADFAYMEDGKPVVEDTKGVETQLFKWKKRHFEAEYGIKLRVIK